MNPAVWGRLTPQQFRFGGYAVQGRTLTLRLGLDALLETYVGRQPEPVAPAPLPALARRAAAVARSDLHIPVVADYAVLEPVIAKALDRRARRPSRDRGLRQTSPHGSTISPVYGTGEGRDCGGWQLQRGLRSAADRQGPAG